MIKSYLSKEIQKNQISIGITLLSLIILSVLYLYLPVYEKYIQNILLEKDLEKEVDIAKNVIKKIKEISEDSLISKISDRQFIKNASGILEVLNTPNTEYLYIIFESNRQFFIALDASKKDRMKPFEYIQLLPAEIPIVNQGIKEGEYKYLIHTNTSTLGLTLYIPFKDKDNINYIFIKDYTIKEVQEIKSLVDSIRRAVFGFIILIVSLANVAIIGIIKTLYYKKRSFIDNLTGLYNRNYLEEIENKNLKDFVVIVADIDFFKKINDTYGHLVGDKILKTVAKNIKKNVRENDIVIRYGGEEFLILLQKERNLDNINYINVAERIRSSVENLKIKINEDDYIKTTLSIGVFLDTDKVKSLQEAIKKADVALYKAKNKGRNRIEIYDEETQSSEKALKVSQIKEAIEDKRLFCLYQPIISLKDSKVSHYEALVRVKDKEGNTIPPYQFLNTIENTFLYTKLTKEVMEYNLKILKEHPYIKVSINLKPSDILNRSTIDMLLDIAKQESIIKRLMIEIVETEDALAYEEIVKIISSLKEAGYVICLDDFGSGYSNFVYLLRLNIDYLKIDANLIKNITTDKVSFEVVKMINDFCKKMKIKTIAEYVENEDILKIIKYIGVDYGQGYYFAKPKPIEELIKSSK
ncbi:putative bifunctional diguanylate cyclase/phosphodiesterase [Sulfurihydrogenibium subterraneum]|uniref:putative bifunctional diguanylate cyclase/phosphodiesterase n=1 Tax=Sulfurihydrogenibium subterraneum TaxID=171121 RepID=UPI00048E0439|nr:bifunctional diguanylate cyclase/phosphodiesterase [Sulfurihydrogenibium subterraneum]